MKRSVSKKKEKINKKAEKAKAKSQSRSKSKDKKPAKAVKKVKEEKKKAVKEEQKQPVPVPQPIIVQPIVYARATFLGVRQQDNPKIYDIARVRDDYRQGDRTVRVDYYQVDYQNQDRKSRSIRYEWDQQRLTEDVNPDRVVMVVELTKKEKPKKKQLDEPQNLIGIKKSELKKISRLIRGQAKQIKQRMKLERDRAKQEQYDKEIEEKRHARALARAQERAKSAPKEPANKRRKRGQGDDEVEQINTGVNDDEDDIVVVAKKRVQKAAAKKRAKSVAAKPKQEPLPLREDIDIPDMIDSKESPELKPFLKCCQTCSNRNCVRAVVINSHELFDQCVQSRAYITSLIEQLAPELRYTAIEKAIANNRLEILEILLSQEKPESEYRLKKREPQIAKFDTGEVGEMAFGVKVKKVQMMRGNRQGNNAFLEDPKHEYQTPAEYLLQNDWCLLKCFPTDCVKLETLQLLQNSLGVEKFTQLIDKALAVILRHGCYNTILALFKIFGQENNPRQSFFNKVFYGLLTVDQLKKFKISKEDLEQAKANLTYRLSHIAALNPHGVALQYLKQEGLPIDETHAKISTVHYAAVCDRPINLQFLVDNDIDLHDEDTNKKSPLLWAIEGQKSVENVELIMKEITKTQIHWKDDHKKMAIHYVCQYGSSLDVLSLMFQYKAKFSMAGGWDKYTPLVYAATYGNFDIVKGLLEVPRLNINKGDKYKRTPLIMAVRNGHLKIAALLIKHNADIESPDTSGNTPLHHASAYGWLECVQLLLKAGADPSPENAWKCTPITIAMQKNHLAVVQELLSAQNINVDGKDDEGRTLLSLAICNINVETPDFVKLLINEKGADPNSQDAKGQTPLYHLVKNMTQKKRGLFQDYEHLEFEIIKMLLAAGANVNIKSKEGKSPFSLSFEGGITELIKLFGGNIDLNQDPTLFFAFSGASVFKTNLHELLISCLKSKHIEDETINFVNDNGYTPFLYYVSEAVRLQHGVFNAIQDMVNKKLRQINNESILEYFEKHQNLGHLAKTQEARQIFYDEINTPFIAFLQALLDHGANPNAYVLKLKQWREDATTGLSQISQNTQNLAAIQARRPPEKDQYANQAFGLCNSVHFLFDQKVAKKFFDFIISIQGLELNQVNLQNMTPFFKLVKTKDIKGNKYYKRCFEKLLESGKVDINAPDQFGCSAFWHFYNQNRFEDAFFLVDKGANINHIDNYGMFALKKELWANNLPMMQRLLEKGADPNQTDEFGRTSLHLACNMIHRKDMRDTIKLLTKFDADINAVDMKRRTAAHYMFVRKNRRFEVDQFEPLEHGLELILNRNSAERFNINAQDVNGKTLLHYAAQRGSIQSLAHITSVFGIERIQFALEDKWLNTPLSVAINCRHFKFVQNLIEFQVCKLKGFIYDEPKPRQPAAQNNLIWGGQQQQDHEDSDMEFMEVQQQDLLDAALAKKHNKDDALNMFRYVIRNNLADIEQLFIKTGYDRIQMVIDYICEGQIGKLFQVIEQHFKDALGAKGSILIQKNEKEQNLIHVLSKNAHLIKDISETTRFYKQLLDEGVIPQEVDNKGQTALHHAVKSGNIHFVKFLVDVQKFDVNQVDKHGCNAINILLKGDRILKANPKLLEYLLQVGANPDQLYEEHHYPSEGGEYKTTSVIHAIRHESKVRENIQQVLKILLKNANPSQQDSEGRDPFMYIAMRNHNNTFHFILDTLKEEQKQNLDLVKKDSQDKLGKSLVHYIVCPLPFGSYENQQMLKHAINVGFRHDLKDIYDKTPFEYALEQKSGQLKQVFIELGLAQAEDVKMEEEVILKKHAHKLAQIPFEEDAQAYLQEIQMQLDPHRYVPCDPSGKFNDDCVVMFDEKTEQHFDVYLTRVEIGKFQPGGDYLFYRMQLVLDRSRDLPILLTRWGRIGEEGAFQKTPFNSHEAAIEEFQKIFEQKTNNKWCPKDKFQKRFRKFQLMRTNYVTIDQKNYLSNFNLENAPMVKDIQQDLVEIMKEICDVNTYMKALQNSGVDPKAMPFSNLDRKNLYDAQEVLMKLQKTLTKLETMNPRPYAENERNQLLSQREKMWYLSSRFYEFIPHEEFRNKMVPPISSLENLQKKLVMINNLIEIEMASKILLGAHYKAQTIHPIEYCIKAAGVDINLLSAQDPEYQLIRDYAMNTYTDQQNKRKIRNIMRIDKDGESEKFEGNLSNRILLFHGSRISNFLGIMTQSLRVQPEGIRRQGNLLGRGIYFSDSLSKAIQYTNDANAPAQSSKFVIVCEVALGNSQNLNRFSHDYKLQEGFNSVIGLGRQGPELNKHVILPDGAKVPIGKSVQYENRNNHDFQFTEYVVPKAEQVRMRYLIQFKQ